MKSRILSFNILMETMKKQIWVPVLIFLGFFLSMPIAGMVYLEIIQTNGRAEADIILDYTRFLAGTGMSLVTMMTLGGAVLTGVNSFSWLHSRVKTDFYHSLPIRREKLFVNQVFLGIAYYVVPYLVNLLLAYVVGMVHGIFRGSMVRLSLQTFCYHLLFYLMIYLVVVLAMLLTGKILLGCLGSVVLCFYGPVLDLLLQGMATSFFDTYITNDFFFSKILYGLSPSIAYFTYMPNNSWSIPGKVWGVGILAVAALAVLCFFLYKRRASEAAGRSMAFPGLGRLIQYLMEVLVILGSGMLFYSITEHASLGWMVFGIVLGGALSHGIMEVIYEGDIRRVMAHTWMMGASIVTALLVIGSFYGDIFGYDAFFPKQEELKTLRIQSSEKNYGGREEEAAYNQEKIASMEKLAQDPQVYEMLQEVVQNRLQSIQSSDGWVHRDQNGEKVEQIHGVEVEYGLNGGRTANRVYYVDYSQFEQRLLALYDSPDYKKIIYPLTTMAEADLEKRIQSVQVTSIMGNISQLFAGSNEARVDFLKTFRGELMQMDQKTVTEEVPIGCLDLTINYENGEMTWDEARVIGDTPYYIYPSFTKTLAMLKTQNVELPETFQPEAIKSITLYDFQGDEEEEKKITDRAKIEELLPCLISDGCNNGLISTYDYELRAEILLEEKGYNREVVCVIRRDRMPDMSDF